MPNHRQIQLMLRNPKHLLNFQATGRLPAPATPRSPLISLLESIEPRERLRITAVMIGPQLGYQGRHRFHNAAQALNWLSPGYTAESYPSQSFQLRGYNRQLSIEDLKAYAIVPVEVEQAWKRRNRR